ncbi:fumarylacetoacetase [Pigmentiphaga sp. GD03639]|uniref:fumarylacetoacetase n=1 Tax=Pigmentiphaga sp. GD03639 TaxID=2975354 RepID=UPI002446958C|nr:fumarylacetoacetase [Pigmentiphaga sp. GD03639]MDH2234710.1 fumarylacetoacetase [Pigmentiphaga sp. GD03639]
MYLPPIDESHDGDRRSWIESANGHPDFPVQNLPLGRFLLGSDLKARAGVALGDSVIDLGGLLATGLLEGDAQAAAQRICHDAGNALIALSARHRQALRRALSSLFSIGTSRSDTARKSASVFLHDMQDCRLLLPCEIGDFTDFNAGIHHAANGGRRRGQPDPLLPNYRHLPIAYHARASSVAPSGTPVRRPWGQYLSDESGVPVFQPTRKLDFELEIGIWIGRANEPGSPVDIDEAPDYIAGYCIVNDWSARDIQSWESPRLGPFLGKSFRTTISPWVISPEALAPFRGSAFKRRPEDPLPLSYLHHPLDVLEGMPQLQLEVWLTAPPLEEPRLISRSSTGHLFWTPAQMVTHHASNGCNLRPGDLFGTGTVTGPDQGSFGTFLDAISPQRPSLLVDCVPRTFLEDGDSLTLKARATRDGYASIGFGDCSGRIEPAIDRYQGAPIQ